ncbi:hypothetical protein EMPS_02019 [Entomortierella parvispora]|uniref:F-box domain-containing protein n=1 Tax=Entomortierella parvispora TaxID=205924 RepID=A0A9P3LT34_9FUNG|nr:hypothetical protein EMPS_02019 [Entomortierella parvispora]
MAGIFPPPLFDTTEQQQQQQNQPYQQQQNQPYQLQQKQLQSTLSPPISPIDNTPISDIRQQYYHRDHLRYHHNHSQSLVHCFDTLAKRGTNSNDAQEEDDYPIFQKFHHPQERHHGQHPLNRIQPFSSLHQPSQQQQQPQTGSDLHNDTDMAWNQQKHQWPPERKFVLSSPPSFSRGRNPSTDSTGSVGSPTPAAVIEKVTLRPSRERPTSAMYKITYGKPWSPSSITKVGSTPITPITPSPTSSTSSHFPPSSSCSSTYESLLEQVAAQKEKLRHLGSGIKDVTSNLHSLDKTLTEEQESITRVMGETERAIEGWERTWAAYSKCEPVAALQEQPTMMASLIQGMGWHEKKALFEQLVASCQPREVYMLQQQIVLHHGQVEGFDFLEQLPLSISTMIVKLLPFKDLSSCRLVSRSWNERVLSYDVLETAIRKLSYENDTLLVNAEDAVLSNWNLLCRYHERELRWRKVKPASIQPLLAHSSYVTSVKDRGEWIVSGGYDEKVRLWEAASGKCVKMWEVGSAISCVELFIDATMEGGGVVVAAFVDVGVVKVWSLHGPLNMQSLTGHQKGVRAIAINETYLITAGHDQTVVGWHWASGRKVASFRAHNEVVRVAY